MPSQLYPRSPTRPKSTGRADPAVASRTGHPSEEPSPPAHDARPLRRPSGAWLAPSILENRARLSNQAHQPKAANSPEPCQYPQLNGSPRAGIGSMTSLGPLRHLQTTRNYRPKTGKVLLTAANIIGFICIFADEQRDRSVWYSRLQTTSGSSFMPKSGRRGQYSSRERRVSLVRFVTRRSRRAFPMAVGSIPSPLTLESITPDPGEHR